VGNRFAVLEVDHLQVRGKRHPERIFTILGHADMAKNPDFLELAERNGAMLAAYRGSDWLQALEMILLCRELGKKLGLDEYFELYIQRIRNRLDTSLSSR
jgi:adenylate cyclase